MKELVIGADGFIGAALVAKLPQAEATTRRVQTSRHFLDLLEVKALPDSEIAYVCAGCNGAKACEGNQASFRINVDAPIEIARLMAARGGFTVFISSMSVEWLSTAYQRQKLAAEGVLRLMPSVGVVRAGRVLQTNLEDLCETLIRVGRNRIAGVTRWGNDEIAYAK